MDNVNFGKLISLLRKRDDVTQKHLSDALGVSPSAISKWENGKNLPDSTVMTKICDFFNLTLDELFNPAETIERLNNGKLVRNMDAKPEPPKKKWYQNKFVLPLLAIILVLGIVATVYIIIKATTPEPQTCSIYGVRICYDEFSEDTVYEMSYIYTGEFDYDTEDPFIQIIYSNWLIDPNVPSDINTLKLSFYNDEADASEWLEPYYIIYLFRE